MNELSLFTGAGGGLLGTKLLGWRTVGYVEYNDYCQRIIEQRITDGFLDQAPIFGDIRSFIGEGYAASYTGLVDVVTAGFPCQPWSNAGSKIGETDERNLWPETIRTIREVDPEWVLLENVSSILSRLYIQQIFGDMAEGGFDIRWDCIPASAIGAPHIRDRVWILAHSTSKRRGEKRGDIKRSQEWITGSSDVSDANGIEHQINSPSIERQTSEKLFPDTQGERCERSRTSRERRNGLADICDLCDTPSQGLQNREYGQMERIQKRYPQLQFERSDWWTVEPELGRVAHGVARRVDRLKSIGNGQVPAVVRAAWNTLSEYDL